MPPKPDRRSSSEEDPRTARPPRPRSSGSAGSRAARPASGAARPSSKRPPVTFGDGNDRSARPSSSRMQRPTSSRPAHTRNPQPKIRRSEDERPSGDDRPSRGPRSRPVSPARSVRPQSGRASDSRDDRPSSRPIPSRPVRPRSPRPERPVPPAVGKRSTPRRAREEGASSSRPGTGVDPRRPSGTRPNPERPTGSRPNAPRSSRPVGGAARPTTGRPASGRSSRPGMSEGRGLPARPIARDPRAQRPSWGSVTRNGAHNLREGDEERSSAPRRPPRGVPERDRRDRPEVPEARYAVKGEGERSIVTAHDRAEARRAAMAAAKVPTTKRPQRRRKLPVDVASELGSAVPARYLARVELRLADASRAYSRDRYPEALTILRELIRTTTQVAAVRELYGLTLYRLGRWKEAIRELTAFHELSGSVDQHPVLADCERALRHHDRVTELWNELRQYGAGSDVLAEGRLVMAGSLADRDRIAEAIELLNPSATRAVRKPLERHLRQWYALADLYERSGDIPRARELFRKVVDADSELSDALERLAALR